MNKKTFQYLFIAAITISSLIGCKKYEEGPMLSIRSRTARVVNSWKVDKYIKNNVDETAEFKSKKANYIETFSKDGIWTYSYLDVADSEIESGAGTWEFDEKDTEIDRNASGSTWEKIYILKLKEKEFWFWYMDSGDKKEFHLIPN